SDCIVYAMKVTDKMSMQEYDAYCQTHLKNKLPVWTSGDYRRKVGDCIYDYSVGIPPTIREGVHDAGNRSRDLGGTSVLLSTHFCYFGDKPVKLPANLTPIIHKARGHKSDANQPYLDQFVTWMEGSDLELIKLCGEPQEKSLLVKDPNARKRCAHYDLEESEDDEHADPLP
ncbi:MAG: hypothetical protein HQK60_17235, partial [Deltaproteobacteria bacterium]|nr:hypothetical protein [Deltaproteobacteria bacterium]